MAYLVAVKWPLFELLGASEATGVTLKESCAMHPGAEVCGLYFSHPDSRYSAISELQKDHKIEDYARPQGDHLAGRGEMAAAVAGLCLIVPVVSRIFARPACFLRHGGDS